MPLKNGEPEQRLAKALTEIPLKKMDVEEFKGVLKQVMVKVGLRAQNWPQDEEKEVLISHIVGEYGNHKPGEILLAFDMALSGQLGVEANCYENFSCLYFSGIMNAYREWASEVHPHVQKEINRPALPEPKEELSDEAMGEWLQEMKTRITSVEFMPVMLYEWLIKKGTLTPTTKQKHEYLQKAVAYRQSRLAKALDEQMTPENRRALVEFNQMKEKGEFVGPEIEALKSLAKKMILFDYLY